MMNIGLWILQVVVAVFFLFHGWLYLFVPPFAAEMINDTGLPPWVRRFIGIAEWLAAAGLVLPGLTGTLPWLTPLAGAGLMIVMASAVIFHLSHRENPALPTTLFILVTLVTYMRWQVVLL